VEPFLILVVLPVLIGIGSELLFRNPTRASCLATFAAPLVVYFWLAYRDPDGTWNWLATLLFSPLAIALALAAVMICFGRTQVRKRPHQNDA